MCDINGIFIGELNLSNDLKILNNGWKVYIYCENRKIIIYISREIINPPFNETIMSNSNIILGYLEANLDDFNDFNIRMLRANVKRQGIGSYLFYILAHNDSRKWLLKYVSVGQKNYLYLACGIFFVVYYILNILV